VSFLTKALLLVVRTVQQIMADGPVTMRTKQMDPSGMVPHRWRDCVQAHPWVAATSTIAVLTAVMPTPCKNGAPSTQRERREFPSPFLPSSRAVPCVKCRRAELQKCFSCVQANARSCTRKDFMLSAISVLATCELVSPCASQALSCQGMRPYELQQCLKAQRAAQEEEVCTDHFQL
jgi:hypothetical protein